ncbi:MAG TPA: translation elongation factor Ts [Gammaproteobacteria bacterium]|nr:translation elongation factor Ts [Gammaproteobacteria bacterium]
MVKVDMGLVKELRRLTDTGFKDCKNALEEAGGDLDKALDVIHKAGLAKADRKSSRIAADGQIFYAGMDGCGVLVEVNSETDFAAKGEHFIKFGQVLAQLCCDSQCFDVESLKELTYPGSDYTVDETRKSLVGVLGENIQIRRIGHLQTDHGLVASYQHGVKIGVLIQVSKNHEVAKDLAMHIAAMNPLNNKPEDLPDAVVEKERALFLEQTIALGKPKEIAEKIVAGKLQKYLDEITLQGQAFVKEPKIKVRDYLKDHGVEVVDFVRFELGEGIEKPTTDFAQEVKDQLDSNS